MNTDIDFLDTYWAKAKSIGDKIMDELPIMIPNKLQVKGLLKFVNFSDLDNWSVSDIILKLNGKSKTLGILADKIQDMVYKGRGNDVKDMLVKITTGRIKTHYRPGTPDVYHPTKRVSLGKGHFRWNRQAHTLNDQEINHIKKYFFGNQ